MTNARLKLVVKGNDSKAEVMNQYQYEQFLRRANQADFDTHLAIDIDLNSALVDVLKNVVNDSNDLTVSAQLKLVKGGLS